MAVQTSLEVIAVLICGGMILTMFMWISLWTHITKKFTKSLEMVKIVAEGLIAQHLLLGQNQKTLHKNLTEQHADLEKKLKKEKSLFDAKPIDKKDFN